MDIEYRVLRFSHGSESTLGLLFRHKSFLSYTLEDEHQDVKIYGETRIPAGRYKIALRKTGGFHNSYTSRFPDMHEGMMHILNVPGFKYVLIHIGNDDDDTDACLLVGDTSSQNISKDGFIGSSTAAYKRIYPLMLADLKAGNDVYITFENY